MSRHRAQRLCERAYHCRRLRDAWQATIACDIGRRWGTALRAPESAGHYPVGVCPVGSQNSVPLNLRGGSDPDRAGGVRGLTRLGLSLSDDGAVYEREASVAA